MALILTTAHAAERYEAMFLDGSRVESTDLQGWNEPSSDAKFGDRHLFDNNHPIRWICDREQPQSQRPTAYIEFEGGDRLPGEVRSYSEGFDNPYEFATRHFVVRPSIDVHPPDAPGPTELRVTTDWVRRIVWEPVGATEYQPGTVWLKNHKSMPYRSIRWSGDSIGILTTEGLKKIPFTELGEIHLPKQNAWSSYFGQVAVLSPDLSSRLIQLESVDGGQWTTSSARHRSRHIGDRNRLDQRYQLIQPAWSLDSIWVRLRSIRSWRFFAPDEVPLCCFSPTRFVHEPVFGRGFDWTLNLNANGGTLQSSAFFGWGFGVHGSSLLEFSLPPTAAAFRTQYGLDRSVGSGGCVNVELLAGQQSLSKRNYVTGHDRVVDTGWLDLPKSSSEQPLSLRSDMAHDGRPQGTDPFDVRDLLNWYEPEIRLDRAKLQEDIGSRSISKLLGLNGWTIAPDHVRSLKVTNAIDSSDPRDPQFRLVVRSTIGSYSMARKVPVRASDRWLAIVASRFEEQSSSTIEMRIDGRSIGHFEIPVRQSMTDPDPIMVPVDEWQGRTIDLQVVVTGVDDNSWIDWRGLAVRSERPGELAIFEDDKTMIDRLDSKLGRVTNDSEEPYSGSVCLKVTPTSVGNPVLPGLNATICEHPRLGQYRYLVFAWKKPTGKRIQMDLAHQGRFGVELSNDEQSQSITAAPFPLRRTQQWDQRGRRFRYSYEQGVASTQPPAPLWMRGDLPTEWQCVQRDLFNDFGTFILTGVAIHCPDGDAAWFDHIYLARTKEDAERLIQIQ